MASSPELDDWLGTLRTHASAEPEIREGEIVVPTKDLDRINVDGAVDGYALTLTGVDSSTDQVVIEAMARPPLRLRVAAGPALRTLKIAIQNRTLQHLEVDLSDSNETTQLAFNYNCAEHLRVVGGKLSMSHGDPPSALDLTNATMDQLGQEWKLKQFDDPRRVWVRGSTRCRNYAASWRQGGMARSWTRAQLWGSRSCGKRRS